MLLSVCIELTSPCVCTCNHLCVCQTGELVVSPVTDDNQKAFKDLTTVGLLQQELQWVRFLNNVWMNYVSWIKVQESHTTIPELLRNEKKASPRELRPCWSIKYLLKQNYNNNYKNLAPWGASRPLPNTVSFYTIFWKHYFKLLLQTIKHPSVYTCMHPSAYFPSLVILRCERRLRRSEPSKPRRLCRKHWRRLKTWRDNCRVAPAWSPPVPKVQINQLINRDSDTAHMHRGGSCLYWFMFQKKRKRRRLHRSQKRHRLLGRKRQPRSNQRAAAERPRNDDRTSLFILTSVKYFFGLHVNRREV